MKYSELVDVYGQLEKTTKRLEKTRVISELLKKTPAEELPTIVLLIEGRLFPNWDERELGVASRLIIKAISTASGIDAFKVEKEWKNTGDLGLVAENLIKSKKQRTLHLEELAVKKVFNNLRSLAELEGIGTVERKIQLIAELLTSAKPVEARYIVRTILQELRIGVGEGSIRDAIVWAFFSDKFGLKYNEKESRIEIDNREEYNKYANAVQKAFDVTNDFSIVASASKTKGINGLKDTTLIVGVPIKVMLALKVDSIDEGFERCNRPAEIEYKYDGFRCITGFTPIYTKWKGLISVKDIKVGDKVLTHTGRFKKVIAINKRRIDKNEKLYRIQTFLGNEFKITEKHPVLLHKNNKLQWTDIEKIKKEDELAFPIPKINIKSMLKKKLRLTDESGYEKDIRINKFFFRFLGYWIGDGFTNEYHNTERVGLIFNQKKDGKLCEYYKKNIIKNFKVNNLSKNIHNGAIYLYWRDKPFRIWVSKNFRREWKGKMLPYWFFGVSKIQFDEFLKGWIQSDGHKDKIGRISITTKERDLAMFAQLLALKFKKIIGMRKIRVNNKTYYKLIIPKTNKRSRIIKNRLLSKILKFDEIQKPDSRLALYNIQVEKDESYCTTMATLHNCQIHKKNNDVKIFTRRLENVTNQFPEVVDYIKKYVDGREFIIDSEAVGYSKKTEKYLPFQSISQRIKRKYDIKKMSEEFPVEVNVFDILYYNGKNMLNELFEKRRSLLKKIINKQPKKIVLAKSIVASKNDEVEKFYKEALEAGNEGIMFKKLDAPYKPGARVGYMIKFKPAVETLDLVIVAAEWGEGKRAKWLSSYTIACIDENGNFLEIGKASTGLKEKEEEGLSFKEMTKILKPLIISEKGKEVKIKPKIVIEVSYEEIQKSPTYASGYALRFPRVGNLRLDRNAEDATTLKMVEDFYQRQRK